MSDFLPALIGASVPVVLGLVAASRRFGRLEGTAGSLEKTAQALEDRHAQLEGRIDALGHEIRSQHKETSESISGIAERVALVEARLVDRLSSVQVQLVDRIARLEGYLKAPPDRDVV